MDNAPTFKFGEKFLPKDLIPEQDELALETPDDEVNPLVLNSQTKTELLKHWCENQGRRSPISNHAVELLGRHRWVRDGQSWTAHYDVSDMEALDSYLGKPKVRQLRDAIERQSMELQQVMLAQSQPDMTDDAGLIELQQRMQLQLVHLLGEKEAALQHVQEKALELREQGGDAEIRQLLGLEESASLAQPSSSLHPNKPQHHLSVRSHPVAQTTVGLACAVGFNYFFKDLVARKRRSLWHNLAGLAAVGVATAVYVLQPFPKRRVQPGLSLPDGPGEFANMLVVHSED